MRLLVVLLSMLLAGCLPRHARLGPPEHAFEWTPAERALVEADREDFDVVLRGEPSLRRRAREVPGGLDLSGISERMIRTMRAADGVGIAGPQVGLGIRVAVLMLGYRTDEPEVIFARNPLIVARSDDTIESWEGCLSVPDAGGMVRRNRWVQIEYLDEEGVRQLTEAKGPDAILWQHELDHLHGVLYVDRLVGELLTAEEMRARRAVSAGEASP